MNQDDMTRRGFLQTAGMGAAALAFSSGRSLLDHGPRRPDSHEKPNFVFIFADDLGYGDLGCYGSPLIRTPRLDRMAREGMRFTSFYAQTVCGPSRASLLTGCYPLRTAKRNNEVASSPHLHLGEITIAEILKDEEYATACIGKWDLAGHKQKGYDANLLPSKQGFDYYFGTPSSNDTEVNLLRNDEMVEVNVDMSALTRRYTDEAIGFMRGIAGDDCANARKPFFLYLAHNMPHVKLAASEQFLGKSKRGLFGDTVEELDWNAGRVLDAIAELGLDENTYVIFASDNGPWLLRKENGGSPGPLRGGKTSTWEAGLRVPCIMRAPGRIPAGTASDEVASTLDMLPTLTNLAGGKVPRDRVIDGHDIRPLMFGEKGAKSPTRAFFYYMDTHLQAVRSGSWKLHLPRPADPPWTNHWAGHIAPEDAFDIERPMLFDLDADTGEKNDVAASHPGVVRRLVKLANWARKDIGDYDRAGRNARFFDPQPHRPDIGRWKEKAVSQPVSAPASEPKP